MPIFTGFAPNLSLSVVRVASSFLFFPWKWKFVRKGISVRRVEEWFEQRFHIQRAVAFDSGRSALEAALVALGVGEGDAVILPGYTCVVVSNSVTSLGATPLYADITNDLRMDSHVLRKLLENYPNIKTIVVQHTFGIPENLKNIKSLAEEFGKTLIEDSAHCIGGEVQEKKVGVVGDIAIFSFGSEKVVSSGRGGMAVTDNPTYGKTLLTIQNSLPPLPLRYIYTYLVSFLLFYISKPIYRTFFIGKAILAAAKFLHLIPPIISENEKKGRKNTSFPARFPNVFATIVLPQLKDIDNSNAHRRLIAEIYAKELPPDIQLQGIDHSQHINFMQFPILIPSALSFARKIKKKGIYLSTGWTGSPVAPKDVSFDIVKFDPVSCPNATSIASRILLLPTHQQISRGQAYYIAKSICKILNDSTTYA